MQTQADRYASEAWRRGNQVQRLRQQQEVLLEEIELLQYERDEWKKCAIEWMRASRAK